MYQVHSLAPLLSATATPAGGRLSFPSVQDLGRSYGRYITFLVATSFGFGVTTVILGVYVVGHLLDRWP